MNNDASWTAFIKLSNASATHSQAGSLEHGPSGCRVAGHLYVKKVPGTFRLILHPPDHDHLGDMNSSHVVDELWFGEPLSRAQRLRLPAADQEELLMPTSHRLDGLPFISEGKGLSHVHYLKVVTKTIKHADSLADTLAYKYTVHSNRAKIDASSDAVPSIDFKYDLSPISIVVQQERIPTYKFVTSLCAIIGGVFTVIGFLENIIHHTSNAVMKKTI